MFFMACNEAQKKPFYITMQIDKQHPSPPQVPQAQVPQAQAQVPQTASRTESQTASVVIAALYQFVRLPHFAALQPRLKLACRKANICGTILLAPEGINGTIAGPYEGMQAVLDFLHAEKTFDNLEIKYAFAASQPFHRMKVRLKKEIVTFGCPTIDPQKNVGTYVEPQDWNKLISEPSTLVIDTRNMYEIAIGTFPQAHNPQTSNFREFAAYVDEKLAPFIKQKKPKKIAMFCTGGIRCEKATSYLKQKGFAHVYHLKGGILRYLETVPQSESLWQGECFVFDGRVSVGHGLETGQYDMCHACRMPITQADKQHKTYQQGISCPQCYGTHSATQIKRFSDRQKQVELAKQRGTQHIGTNGA